MKQHVGATVHVFGILSLAAILLSGCGTPGRQPMAAVDLDSYHINCKDRDEQIRFLSSQLVDRDDMFMARLGAAVRFWEPVTDPGTAGYRRDVGYGRTNWLIRQQISRLQQECSPTK